MEETNKDGEIMESKELIRDEKGRVVSGVLNPKGKGVGTKDFITLYKEAIKVIADGKDKTSEEVEIDLIASGLLKAIKGHPIFWTYIQDRMHGKPISTVRNEFPDEVTEVKINIIKNDNRNTGNGDTGKDNTK
jgi:hypothetical protein